MANEIQTYLKFANLQMAAEADRLSTGMSSEALEIALKRGNNRSSKFTDPQAADFAGKYSVVAHQANTSTGFSGTLFRDNATGELTLSFRSTEFADDAVRDNQATNTLEVKEFGWAFGQIDDMEAWYKSLKADPSKLGASSFNVTGYSLGGHLATAFNLMRKNEQDADGITNMGTGGSTATNTGRPSFWSTLGASTGSPVGNQTRRRLGCIHYIKHSAPRPYDADIGGIFLKYVQIQAPNTRRRLPSRTRTNAQTD